MIVGIYQKQNYQMAITATSFEADRRSEASRIWPQKSQDPKMALRKT
jgi:hypothetical protein